jgi:hypothetical protein
MYSIPPQYAFNPTQMSSKMGQMSEETLMIAFYSSPQDLVQVEAAAELYVFSLPYRLQTISSFERSSGGNRPETFAGFYLQRIKGYALTG